LFAGGIDNAVVLGQLVPVYTCVIGVFRLRGAPSALKFASIFLTVAGAVVMLNPTNMALSAANLCFLARALCLAAYLSLQAPILNHLSAITVTTIAQVNTASTRPPSPANTLLSQKPNGSSHLQH
jgi:drug/metabolite transporter (DMT)-like permease